MNITNSTWWKIGASVGFVAVIVVNALANVLPLNGIGTGEVSAKYETLFAPAGVTFSIWGVIYLLLLGYVAYQFKKQKSATIEALVHRISPWFVASSVLNVLWLFSWHYDFIGLSTVWMIGLLVSLIAISSHMTKYKFTSSQTLFIWLPFSVYLGWIMVATIANIASWLVSIQWGQWGISNEIWTVTVLIVGLAIAVAKMVYESNWAIGLVFLWAYIGVLIKHLSESGWNEQYPLVVSTAIVSLLVLIVVTGYSFKEYRRDIKA